MNLVKMFECWSYTSEWYLVEMLLDIPASEINWDEFMVPEEKIDKSNWQCPYMEQYLNKNGTERTCGVYELPRGDAKTSRVAFYLFKGTGRFLQTPYGEFELNDSREAPERLKNILSFEE